MKLFVDGDEVADLQGRLRLLQKEDRCQVLVPLAWYLRERNTGLSCQMAQEARHWIERMPRSRQVDVWQARLSLLDAEVAWLKAQIARAITLAERALAMFSELDDAAGCCDCHWLRAFLAIDHGMPIKRDIEFDAALQYACIAHDPVRRSVIEAALARFAILRGVTGAEQRWGKQFHPGMGRLPPAVAAWAYDYLGMAAVRHHEFGKAAVYFMRVQEAAMQSGQLRRSINADCNFADAFNALNDPHSALERMQVALDLARTTGWPWSVGGCLYQTGEILRCMGRLDEAQELMTEALQLMEPLANSRSYAIALQYQGDLALDRGQYQMALDVFSLLEARGAAMRQMHFQIAARRGQAHALSFLGQAESALAVAHSALALARQNNEQYLQIGALQVLSTIHAQHPQPPDPELNGVDPVLYYLLQAKQLGEAIEGYHLPGNMLDALARAYASAGQHDLAYQMAMQAILAYKHSHSQEATHRAIALQVQRQTERTQAEGEYHRQLAQAEARRAQILEQNSNTLELLGTIGQNITAQLERKSVIQVLSRHVHELLDVSSVLLYLAEGDSLNLVFGLEQGQVFDGMQIAIDDPLANCARCARQRSMLLVEYDPDHDHRNLVPDTLNNLSMLFAPLMIGQRLLGVWSVQSLHAQVYGAREQMIFRTLSAYGAIALDNAQAYDRLQQAQKQLIAHEKMAALGALVAGVAHELNTPIGNSVMMASALQERTDALELLVRGRNVRQSDLLAYLADAQQASTLIMRGLSSASKLVNSFKQVAVDRATAQRRSFDLRQTCQEIVATHMRQITHGAHQIVVDVTEDIIMTSYPGPLGQVISNLIDNALVHGFEGKSGGHMVLRGHHKGQGAVRIEFQDDGCGIAEDYLPRIFDPFFTTKMGHGSNGLGLSVSYNIVTSLLGGQIGVQGKAGAGCVFVLDLPLVTAEK